MTLLETVAERLNNAYQSAYWPTMNEVGDQKIAHREGLKAASRFLLKCVAGSLEISEKVRVHRFKVRKLNKPCEFCKPVIKSAKRRGRR